MTSPSNGATVEDALRVADARARARREFVIVGLVVFLALPATVVIHEYAVLPEILTLAGIAGYFRTRRRSVDQPDPGHDARIDPRWTIAVVAMGLCAPMSGLFFLPSMWLFAMYALGRLAGFRAFLLALAVSPPSLVFVDGLGAYASGNPVILGVGRMDGQARDDFTRARVTSVGCVLDGTQWMYVVPNNLAVRGATLLFGFAPGFYDGPLPNDGDARRILRTRGRPLTSRELRSDVVTVGGRRFRLVTGTGRYLDEWLESPHVRSLTGRPGARRAALVGDRLLLISLESETWFQVVGVDHMSSRIALVYTNDFRRDLDPLPVHDRYSVVLTESMDHRMRGEVLGHSECVANAPSRFDFAAALRRLHRPACEASALGRLVFTH